MDCRSYDIKEQRLIVLVQFVTRVQSTKHCIYSSNYAIEDRFGRRMYLVPCLTRQ